MPHLSRLSTAPIHLDEHLTNVATAIPSTPPLHVPSTPEPATTTSASSPSTVALSFAFDSVQKILNVVIKDERSGEIVRKIEYLIYRASDGSLRVNRKRPDLAWDEIAFTVTVNGEGGVYDTSLYDESTFATTSPAFVKQRCGCVGTSWKARVRLLSDGQDLTLTKIAMQAIPQSIKR